MIERKAEIKRDTNETSIAISILIDGKGNSSVNTGVGFLDHMLTLLAKHGSFDLDVFAKGDLQVDGHHTIEDVGIVLGQALKKAAGDRVSTCRYGNAVMPMDESIAQVTLDYSGRPFLVFNCIMSEEKIGQFDTSMTEEFFRAVAFNSGMTLHINVDYGKNAHHMVEAIFKAFARALKQALTIDKDIEGVLSSKGVF